MNESNPHIPHEIRIDDGWSISVGDGVQRRTLVKGTAWAVPVVAASLATPAAAASATSQCPVLMPSDWTKTANQYVDTNQAGIAPLGPKPQAFQVWSDNIAAKNSGLYGQFFFTAQMPVVKGTTYTFSYSAFGNYGNHKKDSSRVMYSHFTVNGGEIGPTLSTRTSDFGNTQLQIRETVTDAMPWSDYLASYTASETGTVPVQFQFIVPDRVGSQTASDDIYITLPTITCS